MPETIITIYCFFDERLKSIGYKDDSPAQMTTAEIMTLAAIAAELFARLRLRKQVTTRKPWTC